MPGFEKNFTKKEKEKENIFFGFPRNVVTFSSAPKSVLPILLLVEEIFGEFVENYCQQILNLPWDACHLLLLKKK
jgi:hypothetical protein